jgi:hypothetical protein
MFFFVSFLSTLPPHILTQMFFGRARFHNVLKKLNVFVTKSFGKFVKIHKHPKFGYMDYG